MPIVNLVIQNNDLGEFFNDNMQAFRRTIAKDLGPVTHIIRFYWESGKETDILSLMQPTAPGDTFSFSSFFSRHGEFFNDNMQAFRRTIGKDLGPVTHIVMLYWESGKEMDTLSLMQPTAPGDTFSFSSFFSRPMSLCFLTTICKHSGGRSERTWDL